MIDVEVNGRSEEFEVEPAETLLTALRVRLGLTAAKQGCGAGQCGACTVMIDGRPAAACLTLAAQVDQASVTTAEGLKNHPLAELLLRHGGVQCGFCIPGVLMALIATLESVADVSEGDVRTALAGNLCRCTGYRPIVDAALEWASSR